MAQHEEDTVYAKLLLIAVVGLASGRCEEWSVHPLYEEGDVVMDSRLPGTWYPKDDSGGHWVIDTAGGTRYRAAYVDDGDTSWYDLHLARVKDMLLVDLLRSLGDDVEALPLHQYAIMDLTDSTLEYIWPEDDWLKKYLDAHPKELAHDVVDGSHLITAKPRALQRFLQRHRNDSAATWGVMTLTRRPPEP